MIHVFVSATNSLTKTKENNMQSLEMFLFDLAVRLERLGCQQDTVLTLKRLSEYVKENNVGWKDIEVKNETKTP